MKLLVELWNGVSGLAGGEATGSRKLEVALLGMVLCLSAPEVALPLALIAGAYVVGQGMVDAKK